MKQSAIPRNRNLTAIDGAMALIVLLLIIQMWLWLLSATLDLFLAGDRDSALAGAVISGVLFVPAVVFFVRSASGTANRGQLI